MSPAKYVHEAVRNCMVHLSTNFGGKYRMPKKTENLVKMGYGPDLDTSPELESDAASYYRMIIGVLRWIIELGRIDTISKVSSLLSHVTLPR